MKRTQYGWVIVGTILLIFGFVIFQTQNKNLTIFLGALAGILILIFYKLTITITNKEVRFSMGIGLIKRKYKLSEIYNCKPVTYFPLGWGIRLISDGLLFNVSGSKAIELKLENRRVWIGTNKPDEISEYINSMNDKE